MLQIELKRYASDAIEDAMRLAQVKAMNSYTFSDCFDNLNYAWTDIYNRMACIDSGYYSKTVQLRQRLTRLPPYVTSSLLIYRAAHPQARRKVYIEAGNNDQMSSGTYRISGHDLFCPDAEYCTIWMEYMPSPPQLFFPMYNRDPKIWVEHERIENLQWGIYMLDRETLILHNRADDSGQSDINLHETIDDIPPTNHWNICYISCDYPYIFVTFEHDITHEHLSGFLTKDMEWTEYNPFAFLGRNSDVEYIWTRWNDKTGMGVIVKDWNDLETDPDKPNYGQPKLKELGWTPDTLLVYPDGSMYRYLVARLAQKFAVMNESNIMGVEDELGKARFAFEAFLDKGKSAFKRINIVTSPTVDDWL